VHTVREAVGLYFVQVGPTAPLLLFYGIHILAMLYEIGVHRMRGSLSRERVERLRSDLARAGSHSTLLGLLGTFIGLTMGLGHLKDPNGIGLFMANAMVSTLVGTISSYLAELGIWFISSQESTA